MEPNKNGSDEKEFAANYDDVASLVLHKTQAKAVVLLVIDGSRGSGSSIKTFEGLTPADAEPLVIAVLQAASSALMAKREQDRRPHVMCPECGLVSYHPKDVEFGYCGHCNAYHADMRKAGP